MIKKKNAIFTIIFIFLVGSSLNIRNVLGESRNVLLTNFVVENQSIYGGFYEYPAEDLDVSLEATKASLYILKSLNKMEEIDLDDAKTWITEKISASLDVNNNSGIFSLALESLEIVDGIEDLGSEPISKIKDHLNSLKVDINNDSIGYSLFEAGEASIIGTYFVLNCYFYMGNSSIALIDSELEKTEVTNFIISCLDASGGFKSDLADESNPSLLNTFYALNSLILLEKLGDLTPSERSDITGFVNSLYIDDEFSDDYGSFSFNIDGVVPFSSLFATYIALYSINILDGSIPSETTVNWVLNHQNIYDGGFSEIPIQDGLSNSSSISSYHAVEILKLNNPALSILNVEMRGINVNWGLILGITIPSIVLIIAGIIFYKRKNAL